MLENATVAVLGTGIMGAAMARNLLAAGMEVRVWNRTPEKADPLAGDGAAVAASPAQATEGAEFMITMLSDTVAVEDAVGEGVLSALGEGSVWIQTSTLGMEESARLAEMASQHGVAYVDAPVLGTRQPAEQGQLIVLASGPEGVRERCAPLFDAIGSTTLWLGEAGAGTRLNSEQLDRRPRRGARRYGRLRSRYRCRAGALSRDDRGRTAWVAIRPHQREHDDRGRVSDELLPRSRAQGRRARARSGRCTGPVSGYH
jgi:hypothetical protein